MSLNPLLARPDVPFLPIELIDLALQHLDPKSLAICRRVCKLFNLIIDTSSMLRSRIMKGSTRWTLHTTAKVDGFDESYEKNSRNRFIDGTIVIYNKDCLRFFQIPSVERSVTLRQWELDDIGFPISDVGLSVSEDLLVLTEVRSDDTLIIHLLGLHSGKKHTMAAQGALTFVGHNISLSDEFWRDIEISGDFLGVMASAVVEDNIYRCQLEFWNWKTGKTVWRDDESVQGYCFLNDHFALVLHQVASTSDEANTSLSLQIVELGETLQESHVHCALEYKTLYGVCEKTIDVVLETQANGGRQGIFYSPDDSKLVTIAIKSNSTDGSEYDMYASFIHAVPIQEFIQYTSPAFFGETITWDAWATEQTRFLDFYNEEVVAYSSYGMKLLVVRRSGEADIFDFHQPTVKRHHHLEEQPGLLPLIEKHGTNSVLVYPENARLVDIRTAATQEDDSGSIKTRLPCMWHCCSVPPESIIHEDGVIWITENEDESANGTLEIRRF